MQGNVVQASLKMADYLWVDRGSGTREGKLHSVAVERKTIGNLLGDCGRGHQLRQTQTLRRAIAPLTLLRRDWATNGQE